MRLSFDRGTLLLQDLPPAVRSGALPGVRWDPRVGAHRAPAFQHGALGAALRRAGVSVEDAVRPSAAQPPAAPGGWAPLPLRPYQNDAVWAWELAGRRGVVVLPTGAGKTTVALAAMARTGLCTLCLVPTRVLLDQWARAIGAVWPHELGVLGDGAHRIGPITVATFESGWRWMASIGARFDLLVVDEAHHFGGGAHDEALEMCVAPARLGLTATPRRGAPGEARAAELLGPVVFELAIGDLAGRYLAPFDLVTLHLDLTPAEREVYDGLSETYRGCMARFRRLCPEASWADFARAAARTPAGREALEAWRQARRLVGWTQAKRDTLSMLLARHRDARTLVFTADVETACAIARTELVMPLTSHIGRAERDSALERFRRGDLRALVAARVLNEGVDVPAAEVGIVVGAAQGVREHVQRIGRLLRPAPGKRAVVYELVTRRTLEVSLARRRRAGLAPRALASL